MQKKSARLMLQKLNEDFSKPSLKLRDKKLRSSSLKQDKRVIDMAQKMVRARLRKDKSYQKLMR